MIQIHPPRLSSVDLRTIHEGRISWSGSDRSTDTATARQFAHELLAKCDELDKINEERYE